MPTGDEDVQLHPYFTKLCDSIAASMIADGGQTTLVVDGGGGAVPARVSISLGLIVTELVINALKHAFPAGRPGTITIDYGVDGADWVLCVTDNGVGMPIDPDRAQTGLGTSIIQALARQLGATVEVTAANPGVRVSIRHSEAAPANDETPPASPVDLRPAA